MKLEIELTETLRVTPVDPDESSWFKSALLSGQLDPLLLHSNQWGDTIGRVKVLRIIEEEE